MLRLWLILTLFVSTGAAAGAATSDVDATRALLMKTFDRPDAHLTVEPIIVSADVAIAGWTQGELGGRALLRKKNGVWTIDLCAGDALKEAATLEKLGLSKPQAETLARDLAAAESRLSPETLVRFSQFDGMFAVDAQGRHAATDPHHRPVP